MSRTNKKYVNIFGQKIPVVYKKGLIQSEKCFAYYDPDIPAIYVDADLPKKAMTEALLHECGHALFHRAGLGQSKITRDLEEIIVEQFSIMFSENFCLYKRQSSIKS